MAAQLLIIAVAPSRPPGAGDLAAGGSGSGSDGSYAASDGSTGGSGATGTDGSSATGGSGGGSGGSGSAGSGSAGSGSGGTDGTGGPPPGDTSHCVGGRQFNPAIDFYAPPCTPSFSGDNGGATYRGVTKDKITIVQYYGKGSDAVDAILRAQGSYVSIDQHRAFQAAAQKFINANYELYGRKVELKVFQGNCDTIPPAVDCLRAEMKQMVESLNPFAVYWNTSLCSQCFSELSKLKVLNVGGWHFRDEYNQRLRPYHWDVQMSGTALAQNAGRWWCSNLKGKVAKYAGSANPSQDFRNNVRKLGVISTNDPENQATVEIDLKAELAKCGSGYGENWYFYEQDIRTADQQRRAAVLRMNPVGSGENAATSVMCFCDLVAPAFLYSEEQNQNYYPENLVVGSGYMDADAASQAYMGTLGCPNTQRPCNFEDAFGLSQINAQEPKFKDAGQRVWNAGGGQGNAPFDSVTAAWDYINLTASLIQAAGPNLTPEAVEAGAFRMGPRGDANHTLRQFSPGRYSWNQDVRQVYWSTTRISSFNDKKGTYVQWKPGRVGVNGWRSGEIVLPPKPR
ncbi:MAG: hypothetical protein ACT4OV_01600 [Microthrixaceae bacterium]